MIPIRQFPRLLLCTRLPAVSVIKLLYCLMLISGCATTGPEIDESLQRKALEGNIRTQYEIAMKYYEARYALFGRKEYWEEAARWFGMAASQGDARSQYYLSVYFFTVREDYSQSFELTRLAAHQGVADAQYSLGMHYAQAWGTPQDLVRAYKWIALANDGGVKGGSLADTEWLIWRGKLTANQITEGKQLAAEHTRIYGKSQSIESMQ